MSGLNLILPYGITQCYLPPGRGDTPAVTPRQLRLVLDLATQEKCKAELTQLAWLNTEVVYLPEGGDRPQY